MHLNPMKMTFLDAPMMELCLRKKEFVEALACTVSYGFLTSPVRMEIYHFPGYPLKIVPVLYFQKADGRETALVLARHSYGELFPKELMKNMASLYSLLLEEERTAAVVFLFLCDSLEKGESLSAYTIGKITFREEDQASRLGGVVTVNLQSSDLESYEHLFFLRDLQKTETEKMESVFVSETISYYRSAGALEEYRAYWQKQEKLSLFYLVSAMMKDHIENSVILEALSMEDKDLQGLLAWGQTELGPEEREDHSYWKTSYNYS